jgi:putative salt-induced outer membrane protein YdiY
VIEDVVMLRRGLALAAGLAWAAVAAAQPVPPPPPGGFNFDPPKVAPAAPPPPAIPNDGLFPAEPPPKVWSGGGEIGTNGATGNSELFAVRAGLHAQRKTADNLFVSDFLYTYARQNSLLTQNQALLNARDEILLAGTPWSLFAATNTEYDELRAYRFRVGVYGGVGYQVIDTDVTNWRVRAGAGAVREIAGYSGGPADRWVPELVFGTDYGYKFDDRQSFEATVDYYPRVNDFSQFRVRARVAYQVIVDKDNGIVLRLGAQDRYDSNPGPAKKNDLTYFATLGFAF